MVLKKARDLLEKGIQYLEFRLFDLNPFAPYGMELADAKFIHYFILLMAWLDDTADQEGIKLGKARLAEVAWEDPREQSVYAVEGELVLLEMLKMLEQLNASDEIKTIVKDKLGQFADPSQTLCAKVVAAIEQVGSYQQLGADIAQSNKAKAFERFYALSAFDNMELSTQALLFDAIQKGLKIEILDETRSISQSSIWRPFGICEKW